MGEESSMAMVVVIEGVHVGVFFFRKGEPSPGADVARSEPSPSADISMGWGEPSPGADVECASLVPVQMRQG